ncbi:trypsin-like peptidase domain-containing protein [Candidatus Woesearchaeota archaeon]|nr:trypsin-like peptidase domain-containing protein [Candidatus Woesearchaeota archaeon]
MNRRSQRVLIIVLLILIIFLQLAVIYTSFNKQKAAGISLNQEAGYYIQAAAKKVIPAVVYIEAIDKSGSGSIISNDGYIITNSHVVSDSSNITVRLSDKRIFKAKLIGSDPQTDVALLKINAEYLTAMEFGDSDAVDVGDNVIAIGNPFGFDFTVTTGIISAKHRERGPTEYRDFLQTDASINPGNSGGPLINSNGKLIGMTTFIVSDVRTGELGFAIPSNLIKIIFDRLIKYGKIDRSYLGISLQDKIIVNADGEGKILDGSEIVLFDPKGPAVKSGLQKGDIIIKINNKSIEGSNQLRNYVAWLPVGENIYIDVLRNDKELSFNLTTVLRPNNF